MTAYDVGDLRDDRSNLGGRSTGERPRVRDESVEVGARQAQPGVGSQPVDQVVGR